MKLMLAPHATISHFLTYGGPKFIKMIQKNNILPGIIFYECMAGGKIKRLDSLSPRGEDNQGGVQDIPGQLARWAASQLWLARPPGGQVVQGDKINWDTGIRPIMCPCSARVLISHLNIREKQLGLKSTLFGMHIYLHFTQSLSNFQMYMCM